MPFAPKQRGPVFAPAAANLPGPGSSIAPSIIPTTTLQAKRQPASAPPPVYRPAAVVAPGQVRAGFAPAVQRKNFGIGNAPAVYRPVNSPIQAMPVRQAAAGGPAILSGQPNHPSAFPSRGVARRGQQDSVQRRQGAASQAPPVYRPTLPPIQRKVYSSAAPVVDRPVVYRPAASAVARPGLATLQGTVAQRSVARNTAPRRSIPACLSAGQSGVVQREVISDEGGHRSSYDDERIFKDIEAARRHDVRQERFTAGHVAADRLKRETDVKAFSDQPYVGRARDSLIRTRFNFPQASHAPDADPSSEARRMAHIDRMQRMFSLSSGSASHDALARSVGTDLLGNMLSNVRTIGRANQTRLGEGMLGTDRAKAVPIGDGAYRSRWGGDGSFILSDGVDERGGFDSGRDGPSWRSVPLGAPGGAVADRAPVQWGLHSHLDVQHSTGESPHFAPVTHILSLNETDRLHYGGHELQHAHDHIHGDLDLNTPEHRLHSELNAHRQQRQVATEAGETLEWRSYPHNLVIGADAQAASYVGKVSKGYTGDMASSAAAVGAWQIAHPRADPLASIRELIRHRRPAKRWEMKSEGRYGLVLS
jgi:hypothetical protein